MRLHEMIRDISFLKGTEVAITTSKGRYIGKLLGSYDNFYAELLINDLKMPFYYQTIHKIEKNNKKED